VRGDRQLLRELAVPEHLDVGARVLDQALLDQRLDVDRVAVGKDALEVTDVDRNRRRPEGPDRHRVLRGRAALLADAHVKRHLAALEAGAHLGRPGTGLLALDPAPRVPALAGAEAASDALAVLARLRRLQVREVEVVGHARTPRPARGG
jgi:hypothetical protein